MCSALRLDATWDLDVTEYHEAGTAPPSAASWLWGRCPWVPRGQSPLFYFIADPSAGAVTLTQMPQRSTGLPFRGKLSAVQLGIL